MLRYTLLNFEKQRDAPRLFKIPLLARGIPVHTFIYLGTCRLSVDPAYPARGGTGLSRHTPDKRPLKYHHYSYMGNIMNGFKFKITENKVIIKSKGRMCDTTEELLSSDLFLQFLHITVSRLRERKSPLLGILGDENPSDTVIAQLRDTLQLLGRMSADYVQKVDTDSNIFFRNPLLLNDFIEYMYNFWRSYDRFIICESAGDSMKKRPYRTFNETIEQLTHLVRAAYRDIQENITDRHPNVYRQVPAGAEVAAIAHPMRLVSQEYPYDRLNKVPVIRQILLNPPLVLNPPMNKRTGRFMKIDKNPLHHSEIIPAQWLCYPAKIGSLFILIYFHEKFFELGFSLCNLFELADEATLKEKPDAVYAFGVPGNSLEALSEFPTVFYEDSANDLIVAAVPDKDEFGYFGYLKKMVLTLHNIRMMRRGRLPFHGAMVNILLHDDKEATVLIVGDTGAGKSETLEALRLLGRDAIRDLSIIADDMGSLEIDQQGAVIGYGTEIGAFLRLDDLQPGYAFGQIDRAVFMSPSQVNARVVLPVSSFDTIIKGHLVDYVLYANNYEEIDNDHPVIDHFTDSEQALHVFREGAVMSKGTTSATGLVHSYFANIFGPPQYKDLHEQLAEQYFKRFFDAGIFVGQMRTRLGIPGHEMSGPEQAARELLNVISNR